MINSKKRKLDKLNDANFEALNSEANKKQNINQKSILKKKNDPLPEEIKNEESDKYDTEYEDEFDDEYEDEEIIDNEEDEENAKESEMIEEKNPQKKSKIQFEEEKISETKKEKVRPWLGTNRNLSKDEFLDFDNKAYEMLHRANTEWPCLSFDVLLPEYMSYDFKNTKPQPMKNYPYSVYLISGTQTQASKNYLYLTKLTEMHKTKYDSDSDSQSEDENIDNDNDAEIYLSSIEVKSSINRIRSMLYSPIVSTWNENGEIEIYDVSSKFKELQEKNKENPGKSKKKKNNKKKPLIKSFKHLEEGFALNWNPLKKGQFASGSLDRKIFLYQASDETFSDFTKQSHPYIFHDASVEDIQFSPVEEFAFASCSVDKTIRVCDTRVGNLTTAQLVIKAHDCDVNVLSWSKIKTTFLASGADDGCFKIWDLRFIKDPVAEMLWHNEAITSICFQHDDESVVSVASADNRISIWDFAVEPDETIKNEEEIPDQLIFVHQGQEDIKEIGYHPLYSEMIISTSNSGFNVFKPNLNEPEHNSESEDENENKNSIPKIKETDLDKYLEKMDINS